MYSFFVFANVYKLYKFVKPYKIIYLNKKIFSSSILKKQKKLNPHLVHYWLAIKFQFQF